MATRLTERGKLFDQTAKATTPRRDALPSSCTSATLTEEWEGCRKDNTTGPALIIGLRCRRSACPVAVSRRRSACAPAFQLKQPGERIQVAQQLVSAGGGPGGYLSTTGPKKRVRDRQRYGWDGDDTFVATRLGRPGQHGCAVQKANWSSQFDQTKSTVPYPLWSAVFHQTKHFVDSWIDATLTLK
jgi:hypothetical protein